jgi:ABC-2 type transport system permease protein
MLYDSLRLYFHYVAISLRAQLQYRASTLIQIFAHFLVTATEFFGLAALFKRFGSFTGWSLAEVGLLYGMIGIAFALAESIPRGFDVFPRLIRSGDFDRVLLRPRSSAFQILGQELQLMRLGRLTQALIVLFASAAHLPVAWTAGHVMLVIVAILGGACLFSGLFIIQATICFWTIESIELVNCLTYGGVEAGQFPVTIYRPWFRSLLLFIVPLATINYFPAHAILPRVEPLGSSHIFQILAPIAGLLFLLVSLQLWRFGVRHYRSTGS